MTLNGSALNCVFIASRIESPVSLKVVQKKMKQLQGRDLKTHKLKKGKVFSFIEGNRIHWFSIDGAYLLAETKKTLTNENYQALLKRVHKRL